LNIQTEKKLESFRLWHVDQHKEIEIVFGFVLRPLPFFLFNHMRQDAVNFPPVADPNGNLSKIRNQVDTIGGMKVNRRIKTVSFEAEAKLSCAPPIFVATFFVVDNHLINPRIPVEDHFIFLKHERGNVAFRKSLFDRLEIRG